MFACNGAGLRSGMNLVLITDETGFAKRDIRGGLLCSHATALGFGQGWISFLSRGRLALRKGVFGVVSYGCMQRR